VTDTNGCGATSSGQHIDLSGIPLIGNAEGIKVYPNPTISGCWQIELSGEWIGASCELVDARGKLIDKSEIRSTKFQINLNIERGVYLLQVYSGTRRALMKLVKL